MLHKVATREEIPEGSGKRVEAAGKSIAIFNIKGEFYAIDEHCTHEGGPLSEGILTEAAIMCPWHGAQFDVKTGKVLSLPAVTSVNSYPIKVEGEEIFVDV